MKSIKFLSIIAIVVLSAFTPGPNHSQMSNLKVILKSGDPKEFKTHKKINLKVVYDKLKFGDYNSEAEYTEKRVSDLNDKESGKGDKWLESWENSKTKLWPKRFEEMYNKVLGEKLGLKCKNGATENEYTLEVSVTFIEPGFNVGVMKKPAAASFEFNLYDNANPAEPIAELYLNNVPGATSMGYDFDAGTRIGESFAKGSKMLCAYILKAK